MHDEGLEELFSQFEQKRSSLNDILRHLDLEALAFQQHPLGFAHAILGRQGTHAIRLHIWPDLKRYTQEPNWPIHNHRFGFKSAVIAGRLTNRLFRVRAGKTGGYRLYNVNYHGKESAISSTETLVSVELYASETIEAPNFYSVDAGVFHETYVATGVFTATILLTKDSPQVEDIQIVGDVVGNPDYSYCRAFLADEERNAIITALSTFV